MEMLATKRLVLRPVCESDTEMLRTWRNSREYLMLVSPRRLIVSPERFAAEQKKAFEMDRHQQFVIENRKKEPVGTIYTFDLNLIDGYVFVNTYIADQYRNRGYGAEASIVLTCYMFDFYPIFKVCFEAFKYNAASLSMMRTAGLAEEGVFRGHRFFEGKHHDIVRFAVYRDTLTRIRSLEKRFMGGYREQTPHEAE